MKINAALARDLRRMLSNRQYEVAPSGIYFPRAQAMAAGVMSMEVNRGGVELFPNTFTTEGLTHMLNTEFHDATKVSTWYFSLFSANATPAITWTAANYNTNATEFTNYDEAARQAYVEAEAADGSITNSASKAVFTIASGGGTVWGGGLHSVSTKGASTGVLAASAKLSAAKTLAEDDVINMGYTLTLTAA